MFTIDDIRNIAIQIEQNGEETYRQVSKESSNPKIAELFNWMADEEKRHANWFRNIKSSTPLEPEHKELALMGKNLLQDMVKDQTFSLDKRALNDEDNLVLMLQQSITFELDTILFYEFLAQLINDTETQKQLNLIIEEEREHAQHLTELAESIETKTV